MKKNKLIILGLGPGDPKYLTLESAELLRCFSPHVMLRTKVHPTIAYLEQEGIGFTSFDPLYETEDNFDELYHKIAEEVIQKTYQDGAALYAVPGSPLVAEKTVEYLLNYGRNTDDLTVQVVSGVSFLDLMYGAFHLDPSNGVMLLDALLLTRDDLDPGKDTFITQVYHPLVASELKLTLMDIYHDEQEIFVVNSLGKSE